MSSRSEGGSFTAEPKASLFRKLIFFKLINRKRLQHLFVIAIPFEQSYDGNQLMISGRFCQEAYVKRPGDFVTATVLTET